MSPVEILAALAAAGEKWQAAGVALQKLLVQLAGGSVVAGRAHSCIIPVEARADMVGDVRLKILEGISTEVAKQGDAACVRYLQRMLGNRWMDRLRDLEREPPQGGDFVDWDGPTRPGLRLPAEPELLLHEQWRQQQLESLFEEHLRSKQERFHESTRQNWRDLQRLVNEGLEMGELVDERVGAAADEAARIRARDAFFKASQHLREGLYRAIDRFVERGAYGEEEAEEMKRVMLRFLRCQKPKRSPTSKQMEVDLQLGSGVSCGASWQRSGDRISSRP